MKELSFEQVEMVSGGPGIVTILKEVGKFLAQTAAGEAVVEGTKALANAVGEAGGPSTGGYGDSYHGNLPAGMQ